MGGESRDGCCWAVAVTGVRRTGMFEDARRCVLFRRRRMHSPKRMIAIPTSTPPSAIPTMPPIGNDEPSRLSSSALDEPGRVEPVLDDDGLEPLPVVKKVSKEADLLVVGRAFDSISEEGPGAAELSEADDEGVLDDVELDCGGAGGVELD